MYELTVKTLLLTIIFALGVITTTPAADKGDAKVAPLPPGLYAIFNTTLGTITCSLFEKETPKTVENFVGLAEGTKECSHSIEFCF